MAAGLAMSTKAPRHSVFPGRYRLCRLLFSSSGCSFCLTVRTLPSIHITFGSPPIGYNDNPSFRLSYTSNLSKRSLLILEPPIAPRWLAAQDRWEEAIRVLANLHGKGDIGHPNVLAQYREIEEVLRFEREEAVNAWRALTKPRMLNRVVLGMSIQMWSQIVGINTMVSCMSVRLTRGNILIAENDRCTT